MPAFAGMTAENKKSPGLKPGDFAFKPHEKIYAAEVIHCSSFAFGAAPT
jgi:hypothetical protein